MRPLASYRAAELAVMSRNFTDPCEPYPQLRRAFVYKDKPSHTPPHLARHRTTSRIPSRPVSAARSPPRSAPDAEQTPRPRLLTVPARERGINEPGSGLTQPMDPTGEEDARVAGAGSLRTYLGTAPGVGKTFAMLAEGRRRAAAGDKVVVGWLEPQDRAETSQQADALNMLPPQSISYRGAVFADLDARAAIASGADVVLVDELAHATPDGSRQRSEDVADILAAGLDVVTTANVAHLRSVRDYAARITGVGTVTSVPDELVRSGEVILVDLPPGALRARIASGAVYSAAQVGGALADYFRAANLQALSELARAWMAGTAEAVGPDLLARRGLVEPPAPAVIVAGDSGSAWGEAVIHRAAELARAEDADLLVVHVQVADGLTRRPAPDLARHRELTAGLGGTYTKIQGNAVAQGLADAAQAQGAATIVVGRHRSRLTELAHGSVSSRLHRLLPAVAIEEVSNPR
jgi:two-component system sensor histidine kinase KdpD